MYLIIWFHYDKYDKVWSGNLDRLYLYIGTYLLKWVFASLGPVFSLTPLFILMKIFLLSGFVLCVGIKKYSSTTEYKVICYFTVLTMFHKQTHDIYCLIIIRIITTMALRIKCMGCQFTKHMHCLIMLLNII